MLSHDNWETGGESGIQVRVFLQAPEKAKKSAKSSAFMHLFAILPRESLGVVGTPKESVFGSF